MKNKSPLFFLIALTILVYCPGLSGGFMFDDFPNIVENPYIKKTINFNWSVIQQAAWSSDSGPLKRPVSMLSFAVNHAISGMDAFYFKLTNIFIHILCGLGIFFLSKALLLSPLLKNQNNQTSLFWLPLITASIWTLHPTQLSSVLYVVQRMNSLASLFMILGIIFYTNGRLRQIEARSGIPFLGLAYGIFFPLAFLSKENGALLPLLFLLIEIAFFRFQTNEKRAQKQLICLHLLFAILPIAFGCLYLLIHPEWILGSYSNRDFSLTERLLTQSRVLWLYVSFIVFPDIRRMGLYHDDFPSSHSFYDPWTTALAIIAWLIFFTVAIISHKKRPTIFFSFFFFLAAQALESSFFGLEMVHEHRNYLPSFGLIFGLTYTIYLIGQHKVSLKVLGISALLIVFSLAGITAFRANIWGNDIHRVLYDADNHPNSPRANTAAGAILVTQAEMTNTENKKSLLKQAYRFFSHSAENDSYAATGLFGMLLTANKLGLPLDESTYKATITRLKKTPLASSTPDALTRLIYCQTSRLCNFDQNALDNLTEALLNNPDIRSIDQTKILTAWVQLYLDQKDFSAAHHTAEMAVKLKPDNLQARLNFTMVLIAEWYFDRAEAEINTIQNLDKSGFYIDNINALKELLRKQKVLKSLSNQH